jgi:hypothetical protein
MDLRLHLPAALLRRFARKAGSRKRERAILTRLIELYVEDAIDPDRSPAATLAAQGGRARAEALTPEERSAAARHAVSARWARAKDGVDG